MSWTKWKYTDAMRQTVSRTHTSGRQESCTEDALSFQEWLAEGNTPDEPDPEPVLTIDQQLEQSDRELLSLPALARMIEDITDERIADGKYVSDIMIQKVGARKVLRARR